MDEKYCATCGGLMDGSEYYDDICDECARRDGFLEDDDEE
jgi:hypothetical protein